MLLIVCGCGVHRSESRLSKWKGVRGYGMMGLGRGLNDELG